MDFNSILPTPDSKKDPETYPVVVLKNLMDAINFKYDGYISASYASSSSVPGDGTPYEHTFYLIFINQDGYAYPLMKIKPTKMNGMYPVKVDAFFDPPENKGEANNKEEFERIIKIILEDPKTIDLINTAY